MRARNSCALCGGARAPSVLMMPISMASFYRQPIESQGDREELCPFIDVKRVFDTLMDGSENK